MYYTYIFTRFFLTHLRALKIILLYRKVVFERTKCAILINFCPINIITTDKNRLWIL